MSEKIQLLLSNDDELLNQLVKNGLVKGKDGEQIQTIDADSKQGIKLLDKHEIDKLPQAIKDDKLCQISYEGEGAIIDCSKKENEQ